MDETVSEEQCETDYGGQKEADCGLMNEEIEWRSGQALKKSGTVQGIGPSGLCRPFACEHESVYQACCMLIGTKRYC